MINSFPFLILSNPEIRVPGDVRGKKIAISRYRSASDTAVRAVLERYKLRPDKDVMILQGGGQTERFAALRAGAVDAAIVSPPLISRHGPSALTRGSIFRKAEFPMRIKSMRIKR